MPDVGEELESLRRENARLRKLLKLTDAEAAPALGTQTAWFDKAPGPVDARSSSQAKVGFYAALFAARRDVYAIRWENARSGKSGWMPAVEGGWRKGSNAAEQRYLPLTPQVLAAHLTGDICIGLYPMLSGDQTCWLAADFDGSAAMLDALAYLKAARAVDAPAALEVSRSGVGAHVWIFFTDPVSATTARKLGTALVGEAITIRGRMDLRCYDRLFPSQDVLPGQGPGNLIAAPLHGASRKIGTTVFLDLATLEPHDDQWDYLSTLERLTPKNVARLASELGEPAVGAGVKRARTARSTRTQPGPASVVHLGHMVDPRLTAGRAGWPFADVSRRIQTNPARQPRPLVHTSWALMTDSGGAVDEERTVDEALRDFAAERDWGQFHTPSNLAKSIAIEAGELLECFQWSDEAPLDRIVEELADVLTYARLLAARLGVDPDQIVLDKLEVTRAKYPADKSRGSSAKYDEL